MNVARKPDGPNGEPQDQVTRLLAAVREGDRRALDVVFDLVYAELHRSARQQLAHAGGGQTLNATMLVHEAYLKLVDSARADWVDRGHFFAVAARAMRQIIIDHARHASRQKRGGNVERVTLDRIDVVGEARADELVALDAALTRLESFSEPLARLVELRFFAGLSIDETAEALGSPPHQVKRDWRKARAFLFQAIQS